MPDHPDRWVQPNGLSDLSAAVDEIYHLRAMLADEARIISALLDYRSFPKSRREIAQRQIERMKAAACGVLGGFERVGSEYTRKSSLSWAGADECLTNSQWAEQRGLRPIGPDTPPTPTDPHTEE